MRALVVGVAIECACDLIGIFAKFSNWFVCCVYDASFQTASDGRLTCSLTFYVILLIYYDVQNDEVKYFAATSCDTWKTR